MHSRRVPPPKLKGPWEIWAEEVLASVEAVGSWSGSHQETLAAAQRKLQRRSMREQEQSAAQGWDTPEGLLGRWIRLHRLDYEVTGDKLTIRVRVKAAPKVKKSTPGAPLRLFDEVL
jgi:hypothetical protein